MAEQTGHISFEDETYWTERTQDVLTNGLVIYNTKDIKGVWEYFKYCLQTKNRFFFDHPAIPFIIQRFNNHEWVLPKGINIYRARIDKDREYENQCWLARSYIDLMQMDPNSPFFDAYQEQAKKIQENKEYQEFQSRYDNGFEGFDAQGSGAPSFDKVAAGRCNPEHVVFLYAANDEHTATAEVRPYIRDAVSVAVLSVKKDLRLVDFYYEYDGKGLREIDDIFHDVMREEFSTLNKGDKEAYLATQYLSLLAQHQGFDGIRFRSSLVEKGANYVIFDPSNCEALSSKMYVIKKVTYDLFPILD